MLLISALLLIYSFVYATNSSSIDVPIVQQFSVQRNFTYCFTINVGNPARQILMDIDYGSADLSIRLNTDEISNLDVENGTIFQITKDLFVGTALLSDGRKISGAYASSNITLSDVYIDNVTILLGRQRHVYTHEISSRGIKDVQSLKRNLFGLGPRALQAGVFYIDQDGRPNPVYDTIFDKLPKLSGGFSVWIEPGSKSWGELVLGGMDDAHYLPGTLQTLPIVNFQNRGDTQIKEPLYLGLECLSMTIEYDDPALDVLQTWNFENTENNVAILNSSRNFSMPFLTVEALAMQLGGQYSSLYGTFLVKCSKPKLYITFTNNYRFYINPEDYIMPLNMQDENGSPVCLLLIELSDKIYLSNKLLSRYYLAVNYETNEIMLGAPAPAAPKRLHKMGTGPPATTITEIPYPSPTQENQNTLQGVHSDESIQRLSFDASRASSLYIVTK